MKRKLKYCIAINNPYHKNSKNLALMNTHATTIRSSACKLSVSHQNGGSNLKTCIQKSLTYLVYTKELPWSGAHVALNFILPLTDTYSITAKQTRVRNMARAHAGQNKRVVDTYWSQ